MSNRSASKPAPRPVYDEKFAKRAAEAMKTALAKRTGR